MDGKKVLIVALVLFAGWYLWSSKQRASRSPATAPAGTDAATGLGSDCVRQAEDARRQLTEAASLAGRPPVNPDSWRDAEGRVSSAISSAESACSSGPSAEPAKAALSTMRTLLGELGTAAQGAGGAANAGARMEEIDSQLDRARAAR